MVQHLDYLHLPFRCTTCRRTGHLRKDYHNGYGLSEAEDDLDLSTKDMHYIEERLEEQGSMGGCETE